MRQYTRQRNARNAIRPITVEVHIICCDCGRDRKDGARSHGGVPRWRCPKCWLSSRREAARIGMAALREKRQRRAS